MDVIRTGIIFDFAGANAPARSVLCDGQELSKATYADLYAVIGDLWNNTNGAANPITGNFRVPPQNSGAGDPMFMCTQPATVGTYLNGVNKTHNHSITTNNTGAHTHGITWNYRSDMRKFTASGQSPGNNTNTYTSYSGAHTHTVTINNQGSTVSPLPSCMTVLRCIYL